MTLYGKSNLIPVTTTRRETTLTTEEYKERWIMCIEENLKFFLTRKWRVDKDIGNPLGTNE